MDFYVIGRSFAYPEQKEALINLGSCPSTHFDCLADAIARKRDR